MPRYLKSECVYKRLVPAIFHVPTISSSKISNRFSRNNLTCIQDQLVFKPPENENKMMKMMIIAAVAMLAAMCQGTVVSSDSRHASNVDCSYAETVMRKAEEGKVKLSDDEQTMLEVAAVHCSKTSTSNEEDVVIRQWGSSPPPLVCPCTCSDKYWAERECRDYRFRYLGCVVTKNGCPHGKFMCCGAH